MNGRRGIFFPGAAHAFGKDGVLLDVFNAQGDRWTGVFAFGMASPFPRILKM